MCDHYTCYIIHCSIFLHLDPWILSTWLLCDLFAAQCHFQCKFDNCLMPVTSMQATLHLQSLHDHCYISPTYLIRSTALHQWSKTASVQQPMHEEEYGLLQEGHCALKHCAAFHTRWWCLHCMLNWRSCSAVSNVRRCCRCQASFWLDCSNWCVQHSSSTLYG